ncbi:MAG TPA: amino acid adenylation domain-containing protein [Steroidobacteraceae bacterium]|nr:amino acid adenylation domain-containing protein [Steroidobacteraceae bacterium]
MSEAAKSNVTAVDYDPFAGTELARAVPTTEAQREIWLAVQLGPEASMAYNESITLHLHGRLHRDALQQALAALVERHESLRTTFSDDGNNMLIAARGELRADAVDLTAKNASERAAICAALKAAAVETPFDLLNGPLMRAQLVVLASDAHELILTGHHIVCDGWSFGVLSRDLMQLYEGFVGGQGNVTLATPDSFGDFALAQLDDAHVATAQNDTRYWLSRFPETPPVLDLPADRARPAIRRFESRREDLALDAGLIAAVKAAGSKQGASLFVSLFTTFTSLVARLARAEDVVVGISAAGQAVEDKQSLVGHCVNLLPVRMNVDVERPMADLLKQGRGAILDAYDHQSCTFGSLLKRLKLPRDVSRPSLVSVVFNLDTAIKSSELSKGGLRVSLESNPRHFENFEAFLNASETEDGVVLELQYNAALFDRTTVQRWLVLYRRALQRLAADPKAVVADILAPDESDSTAIAAFNQTDRAYELQLRLGDLLLRGMRSRPEATAVVFEGRSVSFQELEGLAWSIAARLRERGAGPGTLVGVCLERSVEMVAALVGVIFAGAAYVPLDPTLPPDRLRQMGDDASLKLLLTREREAARAGAGFPPDAAVIKLDGLQVAAPGSITGSVADPAYVIFTSGSTGRPKGAMNSHRGIVNRLFWMQEAYGLTPGDRVMQKTPFTFDVSVWEFFWPLFTGATLVVARPEGHRDGGYLIDLIRREKVTVLHFVPSMLRLFLAEAGCNACDSLRQVVCSGEALPADLVERFFAALPKTRLANLYGPTEAAVDVTAWECDPADRSGTVPIGRPIANTRMYVLDEKFRPLPIGVPGDLYIGGVQVGMGYVARPELTAERFLADPFVPNGRMYKTGDVASWRADGALIYLGRSDFQVKLRGYRIELGEIEAQLQRHSSVAASVVVTWGDPTGDMRLVAYVVPKPGEKADGAALRDFLRAALPDYMVPQHVVSLPVMPLLSSGKVDRRALPAPQFQAAAAGERVAPSTPTETAVLAAMEETLKLPGLGATDDFFALGGHSLLAARLATRLNREFEVAVPMRSVFEFPTAQRLAACIDAARGAPASKVIGISRAADQTVAPLTIMQERIRFMEEMHPGRVVYNTPSAHRLTGPMDVKAFGNAFAELVRRQPMLRTVIQRDGAGFRQRVLAQIDATIPYDDLSQIPAERREGEMLRRMQAIVDRPMDIYSAPLFRTSLFRMGEKEHVFFFMPHHIIWDGWSFDLLYQEMAALYPAALSGSRPAIADPPVSYVDFAHWHARWLESEDLQNQLRFWKSRYAAIESPRSIPTDRPRKAGMSGTGASVWVRVDKALTEKLRDVARAADSTLNMLTMAVYTALLTEAVGGRSLVVGVPVRGRMRGEVESVMGFFNNLLPVHIDVDLGQPLPQWIRTVKRELLDVFANQEVPFERLATEPEISRHAQKSGLYQSLFSFQDARERERSWGELKHSSVLVMQKGATEDFGLWLMEVPAGLEGGFNYNADVFEASTAEAFRSRYLGLLERVVANPDVSVDALLALPGADRDRFRKWVDSRRGDAAQPSAAAAPPTVSGAARLGGAELSLAAIWSRLLGVDIAQLRAEDNFFDLGGNSLLAMQAVAATEQELGVAIEAKRYVYESLMQIAASLPAAGARAAAAAASPSGGGQRQLAQIWAGLLGLQPDQLQGSDNFFDLGGNSLLAMTAIETTEKQLGVRMEAKRYVYETLAQLGQDLDGRADRPQAAPASEKSEGSGILSRLFGNRRRGNG